MYLSLRLSDCNKGHITTLVMDAMFVQVGGNTVHEILFGTHLLKLIRMRLNRSQVLLFKSLV